MNLKGVSPLIAAVLLIAVTMAIAGVMATWATTFTAGKVDEANIGADCIGAIDISSLTFSNTTVSIKIRNVAERINLTNIRASVEYGDATKNKEILISDYNATDPLAPGSTTPSTSPAISARCSALAPSSALARAMAPKFGIAI